MILLVIAIVSTFSVPQGGTLNLTLSEQGYVELDPCMFFEDTKSSGNFSPGDYRVIVSYGCEPGKKDILIHSRSGTEHILIDVEKAENINQKIVELQKEVTSLKKSVEDLSQKRDYLQSLVAVLNDINVQLYDKQKELAEKNNMLTSELDRAKQDLGNCSENVINLESKLFSMQKLLDSAKIDSKQFLILFGFLQKLGHFSSCFHSWSFLGNAKEILMRIFVLGPAGSGKSTLVKEFSKFLEDLGYETKCVNLDPASEPVYRADVDIRKYIRAEEVMKRYNLGINGAMLKSIDLMLEFSENLKLDSDFVLYDTPGQMEIFIYSESGLELAGRLGGVQTCGLFLIDSGMVRTPEKFVSAVLQNVVVMLRLSIPTLTVLTKSDLWDIDVKSLLSEIKSAEGILSEIMERMVPLVEYTTLRYKIIKISSVKKSGFHELLSALREIFCACGDLS